jgi:hypothetical protein
MKYEERLLSLFGLLTVEENTEEGKDERTTIFGDSCEVLGEITKGKQEFATPGVTTVGYKTSFNYGNIVWENTRKDDKESNSNEEYCFILVCDDDVYNVTMRIGTLPSLSIKKVVEEIRPEDSKEEKDRKEAAKFSIDFSAVKNEQPGIDRFALSYEVGLLKEEIAIAYDCQVYKYVGVSTNHNISGEECEKYEFTARPSTEVGAKEKGYMVIEEILSTKRKVLESDKKTYPITFRGLVAGNDHVLDMFDSAREETKFLFGLDLDIFELLCGNQKNYKALKPFMKQKVKVNEK